MTKLLYTLAKQVVFHPYGAVGNIDPLLYTLLKRSAIQPYAAYGHTRNVGYSLSLSKPSPY